MMKRSHDEPHGSGTKKLRGAHQPDHDRKHSTPQQGSRGERSRQDVPKKEIDYRAASQQLPPPSSAKADAPAYTPFTVAKNLPDLPKIYDPRLANSPFVHKSFGYDRTSTTTDLSYERLEFLGDAYLELFASRLIFHHFPALPAGAQSQVRELLVKNETLSEYARLYSFETRVKVADMEHMLRDAKDRGNKGLNKILGDVFEAYIAAIVLSDPEQGFARAEAWLTALWAPKLIEAAASQKFSNPSLALQTPEGSHPRATYSPTGKADLQRKIQAYDAKLTYSPYKDSVELKGDQLGQNRHFIAVYLTGYGYENKLLGKGEGKNKVEAGNWAAVEAVNGECRGIVEECGKKLADMKEKKRQEKEARELAVSSNGK